MRNATAEATAGRVWGARARTLPLLTPNPGRDLFLMLPGTQAIAQWPLKVSLSDIDVRVLQAARSSQPLTPHPSPPAPNS